MSQDCPDHGRECTGLGHERSTSVNEIGSVTKAMQADKDPKVKLDIEIKLQIEVDREAYAEDPETGEDVDVTTLTPQQMAEMEFGYLKAGDVGITDWVADALQGNPYDDPIHFEKYVTIKPAEEPQKTICVDPECLVDHNQTERPA